MRRALLTGVGREGQVGEIVAERLGADGFELFLVDRTAEGVEARAARLRQQGYQAVGKGCDLTDAEAVARLFRDFGLAEGLDAVVHMAGGFALSGNVADADLAVWNQQLAINLQTAFLVARQAIPALRQRRGSIVFFASESVVGGVKVARISAYAAAKSGLVSLSLSIAQEERRNGVRSNCVAPAAIRTASNSKTMGPDSEFVEREQVADVVSFLCSDRASAVTAQVLRLTPR
jgi:NAD(P)-dependent dehydrogenase (short-subunit alcohol dehydrogenase family)